MNIVNLRKSLLPIFQQYRIEKAILFGSFARGDNSSRSDLDLILIKNTRQRFFDRYDKILVDLNKAMPNYELDVLIYTPDELEQIAERPFIAQALREGKVLYESK
jgi:predicted nucleotidyltransferase